jgi:ABC-type transport system substrate-binding protein
MGWLSLLVCVASVPVVAQENKGTGGTIVVAMTSAAGTLSQVYCGDGCVDIPNLMYIDLIGVDPEIGWFAPRQPGALAESWEFSEDNRVLTLHLRDDMTWSDGTSITAADVLMDYELMQQPEAGHPYAWIAASIQSLEAPDPHALVFTFHEASCESLFSASALQVLPSHIYRTLIDEVGYASLAEHEWFDHPTVTSGPFRFGERFPDGSFRLIGNDDYVDAALGYVNAVDILFDLSWVNEMYSIDRFRAGEIDVWQEVPGPLQPEYRTAGEAGDIQVFEYSGGHWRYMAMNWADPTHPHIGVTVNPQEMPFQELLELAKSQTFDAYVMGWANNYPGKPSTTTYFGPFSDVPGSGQNDTSFYNKAYFALEEMALTVPGCGMAERAEIYRRMQEIIQEELPFVFLFVRTSMYAARNEVEGFAPYPGNLWWNVDTWSVRGED